MWLVEGAAGPSAIFVAGCNSTTESSDCVCEKGKQGDTVWCEKCSAGYVAGVKTKCAGCYEAKQGGPACAACAK